MKLLSLNAWGATQGQLLFDYLKEESAHTDIFCFQEVFDSASSESKVADDGTHLNFLQELKELLPDFNGFYAVSSKNHGLEKPALTATHGLAIFVKKTLEAKVVNHVFVFSSPDVIVEADFSNLACAVLHAEVITNKGTLNIFNYHGISMPGDKLDTPDRITASQKIVEALAKASKNKILCGDFNLMPETKSVKIIEEAGMRNLIKDFNITNTRNEISWEKYSNKQSYADFTFTSPDIKINSFEVPYNLVSDHLPMLLDFDVQ